MLPYMATWKGLEPSTSGVTGQRSNQLSYQATIYIKKISLLYIFSILSKWALRDSNPGPSGYEPDALTN